MRHWATKIFPFPQYIDLIGRTVKQYDKFLITEQFLRSNKSQEKITDSNNAQDYDDGSNYSKYG